MKYFKVALLAVFLLLGLSIGASQAAAAPLKDPVTLYLFYGDGCPHCAAEEAFFPSLKQEFPDLNIVRLEVWSDRKNADILSKVANEINITTSGVPVTVVGRQAVVGFDDADGVGLTIISMVNDAYYSGMYDDVVAKYLTGAANPPPDPAPSGNDSGQAVGERSIKSFFGEFKIKDLSLPVLTALIGTLDSFNPCALWVLLFLISMLVGMTSRRRMWLLGWSFIIGSAVAYYAFLAAWLNVFIFIGYIKWVRYAIALFAIVSGVFALRKYWQNRDGGCEVVGDPSRKKTMDRLKLLVQDKRLLLAMAGIIILAASINLIELLCSAGLPAVYVQTLTLAKLSKVQYYLYLLLYVFFYVLDQIVIFLIAMFSFQVKAISSRITTYAVLVSGLLMLLIGLIMLFRPAWLVFG